MAERALKKKHGSLRVCVIRPSIIVSCYEEPCRGWTDTLAAGGGLTFSIHMGLMRRVKTYPQLLVDLIPCDFVSNIIISGTVYVAKLPQPQMKIFHSASSGKNPFTILRFRDNIARAGRYHEYLKQVGEPGCEAIESAALCKL